MNSSNQSTSFHSYSSDMEGPDIPGIVIIPNQVPSSITQPLQYLCGVPQLCLLYLNETTGASAEAWVEFKRGVCL